MSYIGNSPISIAFLTDTFSGTGSQTAYTMTVAPANTSSIIVAVTGVLQDPSTYSVSGTTLTFSAAPPSGTSNISVRYLGIPASGVTTTAYRTVTDFTATAGQTSFSVPSYTVGYIDVYRNGVRLVSTDYTATTGTTVVLNNACTVGDSVVTESFYVSSVLNAIPATAGAVNSTYLAGGAVTLTTQVTGILPVANGGTGLSAGGPAFSAYQSTQQSSLSAGVATLLQFQTEEFDTNGCFNNTGSTVTLNGVSAPQYSFAPNVAGYYQVSGRAEVASSIVYIIVQVYKNGSVFKRFTNTNTSGVTAVNGSALVYLNGTTDYIQLYCQQGGNQQLSNTADVTYFQAAMVRSA